MESVTVNSIVFFFIGLIVGGFGYYLLFNRSPKERRLENDISSMKQEFNDKLQGITEHYETTQALLDKLLISYKDIQSHVAQTDEILKPPAFLEGQGINRLPHKKASAADSNNRKTRSSTAQPPKDYAPKKNADEKGTLSEDFGLEKPKEE